MRVEEVNEELGTSLPSGDYETIAGLVLNRLGHVPKEGEQFRYQDLKFEEVLGCGTAAALSDEDGNTSMPVYDLEGAFVGEVISKEQG